MAERRMFARAVINSARFLRMPPTSRLLYYDLGMAADDDGIVEAFTVMRTTGATEDDLRVLVSRGFVMVLNEDWVSYIQDWSRNNYIQKDRYKPSLYADLLVKMKCGETNGYQLDTECIQDGYKTDTQVRLDKVSIYNTPHTPIDGGEEKEKLSAVDARFLEFWKAYPKKVAKQYALKAWNRLRPNAELYSQIMKAIESQKQSKQWRKDNGQYIPNPATWLNGGQWENEMEDEKNDAANQQEKDWIAEFTPATDVFT